MEILRSEILNEIQTLVHVFRKDYIKIKSTQLQGLASLRVQVYQWSDPADFESQTVLRPFLDIVRNENTTGPLTRTAMESVCKILQSYEKNGQIFVAVSMHHALAEVIDAVTQCRFQETDPESDQYVLLMVVRVLDVVIQCNASRKLSVDTIWHVVESLFGISRSYEVRVSNVLRSLATESLHKLLRLVFNPVAFLDDVTLAVSILGFFCNKIQPRTNGTEREVIVALDLIHTILHSSGVAITDYPALLGYIQDDLCGALVMLSRQGEFSTTISVLMASLPLWRLLWVHLRSKLKPQWEVIIQGLVAALQDNSLSWEWKLELAQLLVDFLSDAAFVLDMYVNYDCDPDRSNLLEVLLDVLFSTENVKALVAQDRNALGASGAEEMLELSCLGIMNALQMLYRRTQQTSWPQCDVVPESPEVLLARRQRKKVLQNAIETFNKKPTAGLDLLQTYNFLPSPLTPVDLAQFLRSLPSGIDKNAIGQVLGALGKSGGGVIHETDTVEFHTALRAAYVESFDFNQLHLVDALRKFLGAFRLPGEAQQIDRILEIFATQVYAQCRERELFGCVDVAYLLSFSIIMLNTDLHNANIRPEKKMTLSDFLKNNVNYGLNNQLAPLPEEYLTTIYHSIAMDQFRTLDDVDSEMTPERWSDFLRVHKSTTNYEIISAADTPHYDAQVLESVSERMLQFAAYLIHSMSRKLSDLAMQLVILTGLVAASLQCDRIVQDVVQTLSEASTLVEPNDDEETIEGSSYAFTNDPLACAATEGVLEVWSQCGYQFRATGWRYFIGILCRLREFRLIPQAVLRHRPTYRSMKETEDFVTRVRQQARAKRASMKKSTPSIFYDTFSRFFNETTTPMENGSVVDGIVDLQFSTDDLWFDEEVSPSKQQRPPSPPLASPRNWTRTLSSFYEHMHPLSDASFQAFCNTAWTEIERVVLPPSKIKGKLPVLTPASAIFLEQVVLQCLVQTTTAGVEERLYAHAHLLLKCLDPLIRGNLQVQGMAYENAVFLMDTLITGLMQLENTPQLCELLIAHSHLIHLIAQPVLRGICSMPVDGAQIELLEYIKIDDAWIPEVAELVGKWMHQLDEPPHELTKLIYEWLIFPLQVEVAVALQALKYIFQLYQNAATEEHALNVIGGLLSLQGHPNAEIRSATTATIKQCLLESSPIQFTNKTWLVILRVACGGRIPSVDGSVPENDQVKALSAVQMAETTRAEDELDGLNRVQVLVQVFLHHLDGLIQCEEFESLWTELLLYIQQFLHQPVQEETLELLRNTLHVLHITCHGMPWFLPSIQDIVKRYPDLILWNTTEPQIEDTSGSPESPVAVEPPQELM